MVTEPFSPTCVAVLGAGHVGGCTACMIAYKCPQVKVLVHDTDHKKLRAWREGPPPLYEPGLKQILEAQRGTNLHFIDDLQRCVSEAQLIFVAVTTPLKTAGIGAGEAPDVCYWERTARAIGAAATEPKIVIERSTVPVRTARTMAKILRPPCSKVRHAVLSNPSFASSGTAMVHLASPDVVLIGGADTPEGAAAVETLKRLYSNWVPEAHIRTADVWSAELSKLTANAFLAQRISSINAISAVCEASEADVAEVARAIGTDSRIGGKHLNAGIGFGGSCYPTHLRNLIYLCKHYDLEEVAQYWQSVLDMNEWQRERFTQCIVRSLFNTVSGKRLAVLGFAFKKDTSDVRESPARFVCKRLLDEGAELCVYDPHVPRLAIEDALGVKALPDCDAESEGAPPTPRDTGVLIVSPDAYAASVGAHALVVCTDSDEFKMLDFAKVQASMKRPCFVFDGRLALDHTALRSMGFQVVSIGKPQPSRLQAPPDQGPGDIGSLAQPGPLDY